MTPGRISGSGLPDVSCEHASVTLLFYYFTISQFSTLVSMFISCTSISLRSILSVSDLLIKDMSHCCPFRSEYLVELAATSCRPKIHWEEECRTRTPYCPE